MRIRPPARPIRALVTLLPLALTAALAFAVPTARVTTREVSFRDHAPLAKATSAWQHPGGWTINGWAFDPDRPAAQLSVSVFVDKVKVGRVTASRYRSRFGHKHPVAGPHHGFRAYVSVPQGQHSVCLWATNVAAGHSYRFGCVTRTFNYSPVGHVERVGSHVGRIYVQGYAYDDDSPTAGLRTTVTIDGTAHGLVANLARPDRASVLHGGVNHGFAFSLAVPQGRHTVCARAGNIGYGTDTSLGCWTFTVDDSPRGIVDFAGAQGGQLRVRGWALDPDVPTTALSVVVTVDGIPRTVSAGLSRSDIPASYAAGRAHGFDTSFPVAEGTHRVMVTAVNVGIGANRTFINRDVPISYAPTITVEQFSNRPIGAFIKGWARDPDTTAPVPVRILVDGTPVQTLTANEAGTPESGHRWLTHVALTSGTHVVCAYAVNIASGTHNSPQTCFTQTAQLGPVGVLSSVRRATDGIRVFGWAFDPDAPHGAVTVSLTVDGTPSTTPADTTRTDVGNAYPDFGPSHGFDTVLPASDGEHTVCVTARNLGAGTDKPLGCVIVNAVHPVAPSAPQSVVATPGYGRLSVAWRAPSFDGGAPVSAYDITTVPATRTVRVPAAALTATLTGLASHTTYTVTIRAVNIAGASAGSTAAPVTTQAAPPPQTTPAPVSTSRYIRNIRGSSAADLAMMRAEGVADARANPSGHAYLVLLDIGGQYGNGVILSAGVRYVSYVDLVRCVQAYTDGYHSAQQPSAPVVIAVGTNNDINVSGTTGRIWADQVVDPIRSHAAGYGAMSIAGANDIEPGFRADYTATASWLSGYLGATTAAFVFNGSADGCAWTVTSRGCNNGWSMYKLYRLAAGAAPTRIINLPQIYNTTMAAQWKYISLTGVVNSQPRIRFGGPLTEWTACNQARSCGSMTGRSAWSVLWSNLQSDSRLRTGSLPYSTDLRIDS